MNQVISSLDRRTCLLGLFSCLAGCAGLGLSQKAQAQLMVYDPTNYAQNVLQAARALQQITNQITAIQNQALSLINEAKNLTSLPFSVLAQLKAEVARTQSLLNSAQGIAYNVSQIDQSFKSLYGQMAMTGDAKALITNAQSRWQNTVESLQDALRTQATILDNSAQSHLQMASLVDASQTATGALSAIQAGNQLLALQSQQVSDLTALLAANGRAQAIEAAEKAAAAEQGREQRKRFLSPTTAYQPGSAQMFYGQ